MKRDQILDIVKPQDIKKVLRELEREQLREQRALAEAERENESEQKEEAVDHMDTMLALYQQEIYGNNQLTLRESNSNEERKKEEKAKKHFRRYSRLGHHVTRYDTTRSLSLNVVSLKMLRILVNL